MLPEVETRDMKASWRLVQSRPETGDRQAPWLQLALVPASQLEAVTELVGKMRSGLCWPRPVVVARCGRSQSHRIHRHRHRRHHHYQKSHPHQNRRHQTGHSDRPVSLASASKLVQALGLGSSTDHVGLDSGCESALRLTTDCSRWLVDRQS